MLLEESVAVVLSGVDVLVDVELEDVVVVEASVDEETELDVDDDNVVVWLELAGLDVLLPLPPPLPPTSKTTMLALAPLGTVTTQKEPPPAPSEPLPVISLIAFLDGSIAQGRPLQLAPSSQIISTP
jgi:hypothetical protein